MLKSVFNSWLLDFAPVISFGIIFFSPFPGVRTYHGYVPGVVSLQRYGMVPQVAIVSLPLRTGTAAVYRTYHSLVYITWYQVCSLLSSFFHRWALLIVACVVTTGYISGK